MATARRALSRNAACTTATLLSRFQKHSHMPSLRHLIKNSSQVRSIGAFTANKSQLAAVKLQKAIAKLIVYILTDQAEILQAPRQGL